MKHALLFLMPLLFCAPAMAQTSNSGQPIEITATKSVEWLRNDKQYVARENVEAKQGTVTIKSNLMIADYKEGDKSSMQIWQLTASDNVTIISDGNTATGDKAVYNVDTGISTLTGGDLKIVSPDQTVTAKERMEYHATTRQAKAIGSAKVIRAGGDTLSANTITATFKDKAASATPAATSTGPMGGGNVDKIEADGNVVIVTPSEKLYGNRGIYKADTNTAELFGKVKIERGQNVLEGDRAEVNLTTNVSKMFGSEKSGGRVRGVFFPGNDKAGAAPKTPATPAPSAPLAPPAPAPVTSAPATPDMFPAGQ